MRNTVYTEMSDSEAFIYDQATAYKFSDKAIRLGKKNQNVLFGVRLGIVC